MAAKKKCDAIPKEHQIPLSFYNFLYYILDENRPKEEITNIKISVPGESDFPLQVLCYKGRVPKVFTFTHKELAQLKKIDPVMYGEI